MTQNFVRNAFTDISTDLKPMYLGDPSDQKDTTPVTEFAPCDLCGEVCELKDGACKPCRDRYRLDNNGD